MHPLPGGRDEIGDTERALAAARDRLRQQDDVIRAIGARSKRGRTFAPLAGAVVGLLAGLYPALRATRMQSVDALRGPT